jgi:hypothetical protein
MKQFISKMLGKNKRLFKIVKYIYYLPYAYIYLPLKRLRYWLVYHKLISNKKYEHWLKYKNIHKGKRCFIVAPGPSLTLKDLNIIKNEYSFGVNSVIKILDKTDWVPTYYGISDLYVFEKLKADISNCGIKPIFVSDTIKSKMKLDDLFLPFFIYVPKFISPDYEGKFVSGFSDDVFLRVYSGYSITYVMLQIAVYMGFSKIYLLGCDCDYSQEKNKQHFVGSGHYDKYAYLAGKKMIDAYEYAKKYADSHNIQIFNATRGGKLEIFERVNLEDLEDIF